MKTDDAHIPLSVHYDPYEKTHGQPLPNLFARRVGTRHEGGGYGSGVVCPAFCRNDSMTAS
jgi:hypothetical protein